MKYEDVYPGVDLVYYGNQQQQQLEYDFIVAPGAEAKAITMSFEGTDQLAKGCALDIPALCIRLRSPCVMSCEF